ncbi:Conserved_hypothetical protein [Hexamita inflata]|uniref:Myb-like domain-containing protein n=1 Tax=Hexamita inflata TaxID=28002 RepID=A0ABP1HDJ8_9EUKA
MSERSYCKWSQEEKDALVKQITEQKAASLKPDWVEVQRCVGTKTIRQCYDQYVLLFKKPRKTDSRHMWTAQEERRLAKAFKQNPYQWERIQGLFPDLNVVQLKNKVNTLMRSGDEESENKEYVADPVQTEKSKLQVLAGQLGKLLNL